MKYFAMNVNLGLLGAILSPLLCLDSVGMSILSSDGLWGEIVTTTRCDIEKVEPSLFGVVHNRITGFTNSGDIRMVSG